MTRPHRRSTATTRRRHRTEPGYRRFRCCSCGRRFNEFQYATNIVLLAVLRRLRRSSASAISRSCCSGAAMRSSTRAFVAGRHGSAPLLAGQLRAERRGQASRSWYIDETCVKVAGRWCYRYRTIDGDGQFIDSMLSEKRDQRAARRFLRRLVEVAGEQPLRVTTDQHPAYPRTVRRILGRRVRHRRQQYLNNFMRQDHRAVKQRYYPMRGFGSFASAARFCSAFDELRQYFRWRRGRGDHMPLAEQRQLFASRWRSLLSEMAAA